MKKCDYEYDDNGVCKNNTCPYRFETKLGFIVAYKCNNTIGAITIYDKYVEMSYDGFVQYFPYGGILVRMFPSIKKKIVNRMINKAKESLMDLDKRITKNLDEIQEMFK